MKKNFKRILSVFLIFALVFCCVPAVAKADENEPEQETIYTEGYFEYKIVTPEEGTPYAELVKYTGEETYVSVPGELGGMPLKVIGHESFKGNAQLKTVSVGYGIEIIDSRAFENCVNLNNVELPDSVKEIGDYAFCGCYKAERSTDAQTGEITVTETGLSHFVFPSNLEKIGDYAFAGCELFFGNGKIVSNVDENREVYALILPSSLKEIGSDAFSQCRSLITVFIPEGVTDIKTGTFAGCASLEKVDIPSTVTHIGIAFNGAFVAHNNLSEAEPILYIRTPHCIIEDSPQMDKHVVVYGAAHSSVQAYVDGVNQNRKDEYFLTNASELVGTTPDIDYMEFRSISIPGHDFYGTVTVPTCTESGYTTYVCRQCEAAGYYEPSDGEDSSELESIRSQLYFPHICEYKDPLGHKYGSWTDIQPAGCETIGSKCRTCVRNLTDSAGNVLYDENDAPLTCGYTDYRQIPPKGHNYVYHDTTTCTSSGYSWYQCTNCNLKKDITKHFAYDHEYNYDDPIIVREYICCDGSGETGQDGIFLYTCTRCNYNKETDEFEPCENTIRAVQPAHPDENNDHYCDICEKYIGTSDQTVTNTCPCNCHVQVGFKAFIYKIQLLLFKIFGVNKVCECGVIHY